MAKFSASYEDSNTNKNKNRSKQTKEREDNGRKNHMKSSLYCILYREKNIHTSRECKVLNARDAEKEKSKYGRKDIYEEVQGT